MQENVVNNSSPGRDTLLSLLLAFVLLLALRASGFNINAYSPETTLTAPQSPDLSFIPNLLQIAGIFIMGLVGIIIGVILIVWLLRKITSRPDSNINTI